MGVEDLFHHVLAVLHDPAYREANAGALRMEWPRIPVPGWPDGEAEGAAEELARSASRGRELARLLDPDTPVPGVTQGVLRPEIAAIAVPTTTDGSFVARGFEEKIVFSPRGRFPNLFLVYTSKSDVLEF